MTTEDVAEKIEAEIAGRWMESNDHGVDLRRCLVKPRLIKVIHRLVKDGRIRDRVIDAWLVLQEKPQEKEGYSIIFDEESGCFGLASAGFLSDAHLCLDGFYGDFMTTMRSM